MGKRLGLLLAAATLGCASAAGRAVHVNIETRAETRIPAGVSNRGVLVRTTDNDTIVEIGGAIFTFTDYTGYRGRIDVDDGLIRIGSLEMHYHKNAASIRAKKSLTQFQITPDLRIYARQNGEIGRNVFKD